jgi:small subunit ribosomal protein S2
LAVVTMKNLLESGVHFGHQTKRWDPRMARYIFAERNGIHIIDLQKTITAIKEAYEAVRQNVLAGKHVLFVGTKKQAQQSIEREARRCNMYYVNNRWLGGMLTNFSTMKRSLLKLKKIEKMEVDGTFANMTKKEISRMQKEQARLERNLGGIKEMKDLPGVMFVVDTRKEAIAIAEANKMNIPVVAIVDTNCNPDVINLPIPGNDDAIRAINLFTQIVANAVVEAENEVGLEVIETLQDEDRSDEYDFNQIIDKDEYGEDYDAESAMEVETVSLGEMAGAAVASDESQESFTDQDYSNYDPGDDADKDQPQPEPETVTEKAGIDEDTLYEAR